MMKALGQAAVLIAINLLLVVKAMACVSPRQPQDLRRLPADAIALVQVVKVETTADPAHPWAATASWRGTLWGTIAERQFRVDASYQEPCWGISQPKVNGFLVLYFNRPKNGPSAQIASDFWVARISGDGRLERLNALMPLGVARLPTPGEQALIRLAEPRIRIPAGGTTISAYTRVYIRLSPATVLATLVPSRNPQQLMADIPEELPTRASCRCELIQQRLNLEDLRSAGKLPPFRY